MQRGASKAAKAAVLIKMVDLAGDKTFEISEKSIELRLVAC